MLYWVAEVSKKLPDRVNVSKVSKKLPDRMRKVTVLHDSQESGPDRLSLSKDLRADDFRRGRKIKLKKKREKRLREPRNF